MPCPATSKIFRVGFISDMMGGYPPVKMFGGWIKHLDRRRFEVYGYHLSNGWHPARDAIAAACDVFRQAPLRASLEDWQTQIIADKLDVLIYLEIGLEPFRTRELASGRRLAPVQCVTWGHPFSPGLPNIDYFISNDLMEPPDADAHYSEKLIRLPNLGVYYEPAADPVPETWARDCLCIEPDAIVFANVQGPWKFAPEYDGIYRRIAQAVPGAIFIFVADKKREYLAAFSQRIGAQLDNPNQGRFLGRFQHEVFLPLLRMSDVLLDTIGTFSGGVTTMETLQVDRPLVTADIAGARMRGRQSAAILRHIGLGHRVATTVDEYVAMAVALADPEKRAAYRAEIAAQKHRLYRDMVPVRALEQFLVSVAMAHA